MSINWLHLLGADGVTVVGLLLVVSGVLGFFYIRLQNRFIGMLLEEIASLHQAVLRRDEDDKDMIREFVSSQSRILNRLEMAERERADIKERIGILLRSPGSSSSFGADQ